MSPNPLTRAQLNTSTRPQDHVSVEPLPEAYEGDNNPYRGTQAHGVSPTADPTNIRGWNEPAALVPVEVEPTPPDPIPVKIVSESAHEITRWRTGREFATTTVRRVVNAMDNRISLKVKNVGAEEIAIGPDASLAFFNGYILAAGQEISLTSTDAVYAVTLSTDAQGIAYLYEFTVEG